MPDRNGHLLLEDVEPGRRYAVIRIRHLLPYDREPGVMSRKTAITHAREKKIPGTFKSGNRWRIMGRDVIALAGAPSEEEAKTLAERPETKGERAARIDAIAQASANRRGKPVNVGGRVYLPQKQRATASSSSPGGAGEAPPPAKGRARRGNRSTDRPGGPPRSNPVTAP